VRSVGLDAFEQVAGVDGLIDVVVLVRRTVLIEEVTLLNTTIT
jgi:hypothetical protein